MTFTEWMAARRLLYEEHLGVHLRSKDNRASSEYQKSAARLRAAAAREAQKQQET